LTRVLLLLLWNQPRNTSVDRAPFSSYIATRRWELNLRSTVPRCRCPPSGRQPWPDYSISIAALHRHCWRTAFQWDS